MILEGIRVSTDMDPDTEASLAFPRDGRMVSLTMLCYYGYVFCQLFVKFTDTRSQNGISNKHCG